MSVALSGSVGARRVGESGGCSCISFPSSFSPQKAGPNVDDIGAWKGGLPCTALPPSTLLAFAAGACSFGSAIYLLVPGVSWSPALPPHSAPLP